MQASGMIVDGKTVPCDLPVYNWHDHGLEFKPGDGGRAVKPKQVVDLCVWHWWGFEGEYTDLYRALDRRELGVEFGVAGGKIYQYCDPIRVDAFAAGAYNPRALNVEVVNYGFRDPGQAPKTHDGHVRGTYTCTQNGRKRVFAKYSEEDLVACVALAKAISLAIPTVPATTPTTADLKPYPNFIGPKGMKNVHGHVGHYHISDQKSDPGEDLLHRLVTAGVVQPRPYAP